MLDWNRVLRYIRNRLALPSSFIEKSDQELREYLIDVTLADFSNYFPDWERCLIDTRDPKFQYPNKKNHYYIFDEEELEIFGIKECYFPMQDNMVTGHPVIPPLSYGGMRWWGLETLKSRVLHPYSMWSHVVRFIHPNIVEVPTETNISRFVVEYERMHPHDLRKIPNAVQRKFLDLAYADAAIWIGNIRTMYSGIQTPYGEIPLNGQELTSRGEDVRRELIQKFEEESFPPVVVDTF